MGRSFLRQPRFYRSNLVNTHGLILAAPGPSSGILFSWSPPGSIVVNIPGLCHICMSLTEFPNKRGDYNIIWYHFHRGPLVYYLIDVRGLTTSPPASWTSIIDQWWCKFKLNCAPLGHTNQMSPITSIYFSKFNSFCLSIRIRYDHKNELCHQIFPCFACSNRLVFWSSETTSLNLIIHWWKLTKSVSPVLYPPVIFLATKVTVSIFGSKSKLYRGGPW